MQALFPFCAFPQPWEDHCSILAQYFGAPCESLAICTHRPCQTGAPLNPACDAFEIGNFCDTHASCCQVAWDQTCVDDWIAFTSGGFGCQSACEGPSPAGCLVGDPNSCAAGMECVPDAACAPSVCVCDDANAAWICTDDCDGGLCVPL